VKQMEARWPDVFVPARTADDVVRAHRRGRIGSLMGIEGGHAIENSMGTLRLFYELGVRYMTLTWNNDLAWADAAAGSKSHNGLTPFGREVVREMNRLGMLVDLSHTSPATMADAIRVSTAPVIFSHSSARALTDVPRNVPDDILRLVAKNGGIVMVTFVPGFVSQDVADYNRQETAERVRLEGTAGSTPDAVAAGLAQWRTKNAPPRASMIQVADHVDHIRKVAGIDHVGLGGDFDGITSVPVGLEDVSTYPGLIAELLRRGYTDDEIKKLAWRNVLRVLRGAEAAAARMQLGKD
jgi:membrane dipeptidase